MLATTAGSPFPLVKTQGKVLSPALEAEFCKAGRIFPINLRDYTLELGEDLTRKAALISQAGTQRVLYVHHHCPLLHPTGADISTE